MSGEADNIQLIDLNDYSVFVLWTEEGRCTYGSNGTISERGIPGNLRALADEIERGLASRN